jgi:Pvc16 N-terminal domain
VSTELAVTAVTETLRVLLKAGIVHKWGTTVLDGDLKKDLHIEALLPRKVREKHRHANVVNLFLYRTDVNAAWSNLSPPVQGKPGAAAATPLALNLEYLVTAYGEEDSEHVAHYYLGQAMRVLHDLPMVPRQKLREVLKEARVHDQLERITVTPKALSIEEVSKLWSVFQTEYRTSAAYLVTVVLIDSKAAAPAPLPVLKRGPDDRGVEAVAALPPALDSATPASGFPAVRLGEDLLILGERLDAGIFTANVRHRLMKEPRPLAVTVVSPGQLKVRIPAAGGGGIAKAWPAGIYSLSLDVARPGQPSWSTNDVPFLLAPSITVEPPIVQPPVASFELTLKATPQVHEDQSFVVLFGDQQIAPSGPLPAPADADAPSTVKVNASGSDEGFHRVRLRVDGIESIPMKTTGDAMDFDPGQSVEVKA